LPQTSKPAKSLSDGTRLNVKEAAKMEAEEEAGNELTRTQRTAEQLKLRCVEIHVSINMHLIYTYMCVCVTWLAMSSYAHNAKPSNSN